MRRALLVPAVPVFVVLTTWAAAWRGGAETAPPPGPASKETPPKEAPKETPAAGQAVIDATRFPSLQAAFDALPPHGGLVRLPPGRLEIFSPLVLSRSDTRVEGAGAATCIVNLNQEGKPALIVRHADLEKNPKAELWRVQLADFRICGDPEAVDAKSTKPASGDGLLAQNVNEIFLHNLSIDHCGGHGARLVNCTEDPRIAESIFTYNAQAGVQLEGCHDIVVSANQFEENQDALRCLDGFNLTMTGNNIDDHLCHGVVIENTYGSVVSGNMIEECQGTAVVLDRDCYGITLSANVLADNFGGGVDLRDAWGCAVSANTFTINAVRALVVGPASGRITVTGNNFSDSYVGEKSRRQGKPNLATGVILQGTRDVVVSGNTFSGLDEHAVAADAQCKRIFVTGNLAVAVHRKTEGKGEAFDLGGAAESVLQNNVVSPGDEPKPDQ